MNSQGRDEDWDICVEQRMTLLHTKQSPRLKTGSGAAAAALTEKGESGRWRNMKPERVRPPKLNQEEREREKRAADPRHKTPFKAIELDSKEALGEGEDGNENDKRELVTHMDVSEELL